MKKALETIKSAYNKEIQVVIGKPLRRWGRELFGEDAPILRYPPGTKIGRIFIDTGLCKSWSELNGTKWKNYVIQKGFTDFFLDNLRLQKYPMEKMNSLSGFRPHRVTILNLCSKTS